jgi:hypothetical protein
MPQKYHADGKSAKTIERRDTFRHQFRAPKAQLWLLVLYKNLIWPG